MAATLDALPRDGLVIVHGGYRGADKLAGEWAHANGVDVEVHRADWNTHGRRAGYLRNAEMVRRGADVCHAFMVGEAVGTRMTMAMATKAGIPVVVHKEVS